MKFFWSTTFKTQIGYSIIYKGLMSFLRQGTSFPRWVFVSVCSNEPESVCLFICLCWSLAVCVVFGCLSVFVFLAVADRLLVCLSGCLPACLSGCLFVCLFDWLINCFFVYLFVWLTVSYHSSRWYFLVMCLVIFGFIGRRPTQRWHSLFRLFVL